MEVRCDKCQARYRVDDARIGPQGLTMRCGKCQNTFRVTRPPADAGPAPAKPAPATPPAPTPEASGTMVFSAPTGARPTPAAPPRPPPAPAKPPPAKTAPAPAAEGAGRTMMFQTGNLKAAPAPKQKPPEPQEARSTMVFGQPPSVPKPAASPTKAVLSKPTPPKPAAGDEASGATMMFGSAPQPTPAASPAAPLQPEPPATTEPEAAARTQPEAQGTDAEPPAGIAAEQTPPPEEEDAAGLAAPEEETAVDKPGTFDKAPPRGLLIGVAAGLAALIVAGVIAIAVKRLGKHAPPSAAVETLTSAQADADKDTLASLASAEAKARDALDVAGPRARFPEATAALARIELQWADALSDQAARLGDDDPKAVQLRKDAAAKGKSAFETISSATKSKDNEASPDLQLALADYYRFKQSPALNRYLKAVKDDPRAALIQGMAAAQEDDAGKAVPLLKTAVARSPQSARIHFRLALAYAGLKDDANARAELKETLKLSPQHERAKALMDQLGAPSAAEQK